jgi:catechol 2,3-dioxygenase-like lactoylglutathione lyase family enzyme
MRLQHLALEVRDQQRAIDFYARFFRFDPARARRYPDGVVILHDPDGFALALAPADAGGGSGFPHFGFEMDSSDEVRGLRERLVADGIELVEDEEPRATSGSSASTPTGT